MSVLPKYQLKLLFESGDLITQSTLNDFIDSSYNPTLVAGTGITLSSVSTPSGTTITINGNAKGVTSLTTVGTSGAATFNTNTGVLNIPVYSSGAGSAFTNSTPTPANFPGNSPFNTIPIGSTFSNQTFSDMMNKMLYPTLNPTLTNPSSTFVLAEAGFLKVGDTTALNFTSTFNRGSIDPAYTTDGFRSGLPSVYQYVGTGLPATQASTSLTDIQNVASYTVAPGDQSWTSAVSFSGGQQPLNSDGNNFSSPLGPGTTSFITQTITGVYPVFATSVAVGTFTEQALQLMTTDIDISLASEVLSQPGARQTIDIPTAWSAITGVQLLSGGVYSSIPLASFTASAPFNRLINGANVLYVRYTNNQGFPRGPLQIRFTT